MMESLKMYYDGKWLESSNQEYISVINPANSSVITSIPRGSSVNIAEAVQSAKTAFLSKEWKQFKPHARGYLLHDMARKIRDNKEELASLETMDVGKPLKQSIADVEAAARYFEFYAGMADKIMGETIPIEHGILDYTVREPVGVTAHIVPWNYPLQIAARSAAAAIATGNAVVMKPAEDTPLTSLKLAEYFHETELPKGIFNVVTGYGWEAGAALASHPDVDHVTFTGSLDTGRAVMEAAAKNIVPVTLELGGKSPNILFADCEQDDAVEWAVKAIIQNAGQTCSAGSRLLVEASIKEEVIAKIKAKFESLTIGPGIEDQDLGPIITKKQFDRIQTFVELAKKEATIVTGGEQVHIPGNDRGFYMSPTLIDHVSPTSELAQEEIFGPVMTVLPFQTEEEAIQLANNTPYGLVTGIWTMDVKRAHRVADKVQSGQVFINNYGAAGGIQMPFGGYKKSGFGREKGLEALRNYTHLKNVALKYN